MKFSELCAKVGLPSSARRGDVDIQRVVSDSRRVKGGDCFVAVRGSDSDGHDYICDAIEAGCLAVVCQDASRVPEDLPCAVVADTRCIVGPLAQAAAGWPGRKLKIVGITGTNGKTTVAFLLRDILRQAGNKVAMLGTVCYETVLGSVPARETTPGADELAGMMQETVLAGGTHLVMEVSSHALDQHRVDGIDFTAAVFTNLSGDHLDYHGSMEDYFNSKKRLFESLQPGAVAVLNRDEPMSEPLAEITRARVVWYGLSSASDVFGQIDSIDITGSTFIVQVGNRRVHLRTSLIGRHNIYNCLAATAAARALGVGLEEIVSAIGQLRHVPGRVQRVDVDAPFTVLVDYAHTDDALSKVLSALRPITGHRLILVFGCGGNRDKTKRPRMAGVAQRWADVIIVTSDNPRNENPHAIIEDILEGFSPTGRNKVIVEPDRRSAIECAIKKADKDDVILIAGKGHENYQIIGNERIHFDDAEAVKEILGSNLDSG